MHNLNPNITYVMQLGVYVQYYLTFLFNFVPYIPNSPRYINHDDYRRKIYHAFDESVQQIMLVANLDPADFQLELDTMPFFERFVPDEMKYSNPNRLEFMRAFREFAMGLYLDLHAQHRLPTDRKLFYMPLKVTASQILFKLSYENDDQSSAR